MSRKRLVDPVHVFDAKGRSILSYEQLERRCALLERQLARTIRMLRRQAKNQEPSEAAKPVFH
jgi:uncharacterized small protein (DUF1192 family)